MNTSLKTFLYSLLFALAGLASICLLWEKSLILLFTLIVISIGLLLVRKSKEDLILFIIAALGFSLAEVAAVNFGVWSWGAAHILGVPYWLPLLWGVGALFVKRTSEVVDEFLESNLLKK